MPSVQSREGGVTHKSCSLVSVNKIMRFGNAVGVVRSTFEQASLVILQLVYEALQRAREQALSRSLDALPRSAIGDSE